MVEGRKSVQPISIDVGGANKMVFGIRRDESDLEGNKIQHQKFKEPVNRKTGRIENFNQAAGIEH